MSSSSLYEPSDDDEASDAEVDLRSSTAKTPPNPPSSPHIHIQDLELVPRRDIQDESGSASRSARGTRAQEHERLLLSLTRPSVDAYASMLAEMINDLAPVTTNVDSENHSGTQNGAVFWTDSEKHVLFTVLSSKGKNGVKEIANAVGSKSELEVQEFLSLLHRGVERQHLIDRHSRTIIPGDIPAAWEIGKKCCKTLDRYAELLILHEQYLGDVTGRKKHRDLWIIDEQKAAALDKKIEASDCNNEPQNDKALDQSSVHLTARFFDMKNWIRLSERIFMNPGGPSLEDNWLNVAFADETPSMTADAFADFYALTVSITRRLIQSSLFFAMSRIRSIRETGREAAKFLRSRDVKAAIDVLGMKRNKFDFWIGLPRRCSLEVSDIRHRKGWASKYISYDEVEEILSREKLDETAHPEMSARKPSRGISRQNVSKEAGLYATKDDIERAPSPSSSVSSLLESDEEIFVDPEDDHAEEVDRKASTLEEVHLWRTLDRPVPADLDIPIKSEGEDKEEEKTARRPRGQRKTKQDLVDWRDRTLYRSDWEEYGEGTFDLYEELSENRRKRRRTDELDPLTRFSLSRSDSDGSGASSNDAIEERWRESDSDLGSSRLSDDEAERMDIDYNDASPHPVPWTDTDADQFIEQEAEHLNQMLAQGLR